MSATADSVDQLIRDLKLIVRDGQDLLKATAGDASDKAREMRAKVSSAIDSAKETCERLEEKAIAGAKATDKVIREHPYQSIGVAFGVGLLIGVLVTRK